MIIQVDQFNSDGIYNITFDTGLYNAGSPNPFNVEYTGNNRQDTVSEADRGRAEGELISQGNCDGTTEYKFYASLNSPFATVDVVTDSAACSYVPPSDTCDLLINSISTTQEISTGAADGTAIINASTSHAPAQYSLNNVTFQSSNQFTFLAPGNYTVYVKDALDCRQQRNFSISAYINPVQNFSNSLPVVTIPNGNISRWNAAFNPVVITYQRQDYLITSIAQENSTQIRVIIESILSTPEVFLAVNDVVYIQSPKYRTGVKADSHVVVSGKSNLIFSTDFLGTDDSGFIIIPNSKKNYSVETEITSGNNPVSKVKIIATHTPDIFGQTKADLQSYLASLLSTQDLYDYLEINYRDYNLSASYTVRFREVWDGGSTNWFSGPYPLYVTYSAMQLGEQYGGNMAQYVPFLTVSNNKNKAKWLTDMASPTLWLGLPFEMSFIYSENILNKEVYLEIIPDVGTTTEGKLLNADGGYIISEDASRLLIERIYNPEIQGYPIFEQLGVNRVKIPQTTLVNASKATINLYYLDGSTRVYFMQPIFIKVQQPCNDPYVYLKWINHLGAWDYWRFGFNQALSSDSSNSKEISRYITDWANDDTINDYTSREANEKMSLVAGQVDKASLVALRWLNNSIRCQMLTGNNPVKWQTVMIPDGSFNAYNTNQPAANVKLNIVLADKNIQNQ